VQGGIDAGRLGEGRVSSDLPIATDLSDGTSETQTAPLQHGAAPPSLPALCVSATASAAAAQLGHPAEQRLSELGGNNTSDFLTPPPACNDVLTCQMPSFEEGGGGGGGLPPPPP